MNELERDVLAVMPATSPTILADKSALQGLSLGEARALGRYFTLVVPPVLWSELMGDIAQAERATDSSKKARYERELRSVAERVRCFDRRYSASRNDLELTSLVLGLPSSPARLPYPPARPQQAPDGGRDFMLADGPERMLFDWSRGVIDPQNLTGGAAWLDQRASWDQEAFQKQLCREMVKFWWRPKPDELLAALDKALADASRQREFIEDEIRICGADQVRALRIWNRWWTVPQVSRVLPAFAPFATYVMKVRELANTALAQGLVTPRKTNPIDREYLMYLPYCTVFATGDDYLKTLAPALLGPDQLFVTTEALKLEGRRLATAMQQRERTRVTSGQPPAEGTRFTTRAWELHFGPPNQWPRRVPSPRRPAAAGRGGPIFRVPKPGGV